MSFHRGDQKIPQQRPPCTALLYTRNLRTTKTPKCKMMKESQSEERELCLSGSEDQLTRKHSKSVTNGIRKWEKTILSVTTETPKVTVNGFRIKVRGVRNVFMGYKNHSNMVIQDDVAKG